MVTWWPASWQRSLVLARDSTRLEVYGHNTAMPQPPKGKRSWMLEETTRGGTLTNRSVPTCDTLAERARCGGGSCAIVALAPATEGRRDAVAP